MLSMCRSIINEGRIRFRGAVHEHHDGLGQTLVWGSRGAPIRVKVNMKD